MPLSPVFTVPCLERQSNAEHPSIQTCNLCSQKIGREWGYFQASLVPKFMIRHRILQAVGAIS